MNADEMRKWIDIIMCNDLSDRVLQLQQLLSSYAKSLAHDLSWKEAAELSAEVLQRIGEGDE